MIIDAQYPAAVEIGFAPLILPQHRINAAPLEQRYFRIGREAPVREKYVALSEMMPQAAEQLHLARFAMTKATLSCLP